MGEIALLAAGLDAVEDRVDDSAHVHGAGTATGFGRRDEGDEAFPLGIGQVGGVC